VKRGGRLKGTPNKATAEIKDLARRYALTAVRSPTSTRKLERSGSNAPVRRADARTLCRTAPPKTPPCAFDIQRAVELESRAAAQTRTLSAKVASDFLRTVGAVGRTGRFIPTITDNTYWFANGNGNGEPVKLEDWRNRP
jgi:hypothetical protein